MTKPHADRLKNVGSDENGSYSLKVGQRVPNNCVNLAYVSSPKLSIDENLSLVDKTDEIVENVLSKEESSEKIMVSNDNFLLADKDSQSNVESGEVLITDEFSIYKNEESDVKALYYVMKLPGYFYTDDIKSLAMYVAGYNPKPIELNRDLNYDYPLIYTGNKIQITQKDGSQRKEGNVFKVKLVPLRDMEIGEADENKVFAVYLYTNFKNEDGITYSVRYPSYDILSGKISENTECILSVAPLFEKKDLSYIENIRSSQLDESLQECVYAVEGDGDYYNIYAPSKMITATESSRPPAKFRYKILANLKATYDEFAPHTINMGIIYEGSQPGGENIADILCGELSKGDIGLPGYMSIENPHPMGNYYRYDPQYWKVDLNMPSEFFPDYDVILLMGYGEIDLSLYANKFHTFLDNGGKLIVDNLTNVGTNRFYPNINDETYTIMDIGCRIGSDLIEGPLQGGEDTSVFDEYYSIDSASYNEIRYVEGNTAVGPEITFGVRDARSNWTTVLNYRNEKPALLYKKYRERGTIFFSNCGLLRKYRSQSTPGIEAKFLTNLLMSFAQDLYITTPWIYDHVYHRDNLFEQEYELGGKATYIDNVSPYGSIVAKKILAPTTKSAVLPYMDSSYYDAVGTFYIIYESERLIQMTSKNDGSSMLYAYAVDPQPNTFSPIESGYKNGDIKIVNQEIDLQYTVRAFTYRWESNGEDIVFKRQDGPYATYTEVISRSDGIVNLGPLISKLPALPQGEIWADTGKIFFELVFTLSGNGAKSYSENEINIGIYDKQLGKYYYNNNAESVIPYSDLYDYRSSGVVANDLIIQAWTNYYTISAKARTFSVKTDKSRRKLYLELPRYTDEREKWNLKIHNGGFKKTRYTQKDYEKYAKLMKYMYEGKVAPILDVPVFPNKVLEYSTDVQFGLQPFSGPMPLRKSVKERAEFINEFTIGVNNKPLYINSFVVSDETLIQIDSNSFKAVNNVWDEASDVSIKGESSKDIFVDIDPSLYEIDYELGIINFIAEFDTDYINGEGQLVHMPNYLSVMASYTHRNIQVIRRKYSNQLIRGELLKRQSDNRTLIVSNRNIATYPTPILYSRDEKYPQNRYDIDYENGVIKFKGVVSEDLYLDYTYYSEKVIAISDYDVENGYIYLNQQIDFTDEVYITYTYQEEFVHYKGYFDGKTFHHLDLNPSEGHLSTQEVIIDDKKSFKLVPTSKLINKPIFIYLLPYKQVDLTTNKTTIENNCIRHCFGEDQMAYILSITPEAIPIGIAQIRENSRVEESIVLDTRTRGGGIKRTLTEKDIEKTQPLSNHYWDISTWDGIGYQSNGVIVVRVPRTVLKEYGGTMTRGDVNKVVERYAAYGTYQIIEYTEEG